MVLVFQAPDLFDPLQFRYIARTPVEETIDICTKNGLIGQAGDLGCLALIAFNEENFTSFAINFSFIGRVHTQFSARFGIWKVQHNQLTIFDAVVL